MKVWEENYGADADGNRGQRMKFYELEDTEDERNDIALLLILRGYTEEDVGRIELDYEDMTIEVEIEEYREEIKQIEEGK